MKSVSFVKSALLASSVFIASIVQAATSVDLRHQSSQGARSAVALDLQTLSTDVDFNQTTHKRLQQRYQGYPVWGGQAMVHTSRGAKAARMNGIVYRDLATDLHDAPSVVFDAAQAAKAYEVAVDLFQQESGQRPTASADKKQLMVYVDPANKAHWAFLVSFRVDHAASVPERPTYILDAATFAVYKHWNDLKTEGAEPIEFPLVSGYGGNGNMGRLIMPPQSVTKNYADATCNLDNTAVVIKEWNTQVIANFPCQAADVSKAGYYWNGAFHQANGGYSPDNDAFTNANTVVSLYANQYHLPVLKDMAKDEPLKLAFYLHVPMDNAYFDEDHHIMVLGDGARQMYPLTTLDVIAHELSHGFTSQHSALVYNEQSGGLNEAFSDMASAAAEYFVKGKNRWTIGADVMMQRGEALRYMDNPRRDCVGAPRGEMCSIDHVKDYQDNLNVHYSSGVFNKAFYLLATAPHWNTKKAFDVMVQANVRYWTPTTTFDEAACGVVDAAKDYGYEVDGVARAMKGVGIDVAGCE